MRTYIRLWIILLAAMLSAPAMAQTCDVTGVAASTNAVTLTYDPFSAGGTGTTNTPITLAISRANDPGGTRTEQINFFITDPLNNLPGVQIIPKSATVAGGSVSATGLNTNIFHNFPSAPSLPSLGNPTGTGNFLSIDLGANTNLSNVVNVTFDVTLPGNLNFDASTTLAFRLGYSCRFKGQGNSTSYNQGQKDNAITFPVTVLSALQASYAGGALDFGEVGNLTNDAVNAAPATYTRSGNVNVRSSGPYTVNMTSDNNYKLAFSGASLTNATQTLTYAATFVGTTRTGVSGNNAPIAAITKTCVRAGLSGVSLPVSVRLTEGGQGKTPASLYNDFLNVTVSPLAANTPGNAC